MYDRIFLVVCDSMGFGAANDAADYGDEGADTIGHIAEAAGGLTVPNLAYLGAGSIRPIKGVSVQSNGITALLQERSRGKDTITGHWEMMGIETSEPFITFTETGFPPELIAELEAKTGRHVVGNKAASGTEIIAELGHLEEENPRNLIVYTSADSVMQICGNEGVGGGFDELYRCCEIAREITLSRPEWKVARVIARPYVGSAAEGYARTSRRRDYAVDPPEPTALDALHESHLETFGVGKIRDIFSLHWLSAAFHSEDSAQGMDQTIRLACQKSWKGLCFTNLSDFDVLYGHRRDPMGYAKEIEAFDRRLGILMKEIGERDLLIITADHGNDPTFKGSDHTREDVPFLAWSPSMEEGRDLGRVLGFDSIGASILNNFSVELPRCYAGRKTTALF